MRVGEARGWWNLRSKMGDRARSLTIDGVRLIKDLKVVELKAELERRGLSKSGSKKELVERLRSVSFGQLVESQCPGRCPVCVSGALTSMLGLGGHRSAGGRLCVLPLSSSLSLTLFSPSLRIRALSHSLSLRSLSLFLSLYAYPDF